MIIAMADHPGRHLLMHTDTPNVKLFLFVLLCGVIVKQECINHIFIHVLYYNFHTVIY